MIFNHNTPILYYNPKIKQKWRDRRFLLYPAWMYRIVAPRTTYNKLNILEKAILGLCKVGIQSAEEMGTLLEIHSELATLIISELNDRQLLDNYGIPTANGEKLLQDELFITDDLVAGYIFQDVWTSELMPRFVETEERADTRISSSGFPELNLGSVGQPNYQSLVMPSVANTIQQTPSTLDILKAIRTHSKALRHAAKAQNWDDDDSPAESLHTSQISSLQRISFIEEQPIAVWLATFLYLPQDLSDDGDWLVCDPFGLDNSLWLRKAIARQFEQQNFQELHRRILKMTESHQEQGTLIELMELLNLEAKYRVENKLTVGIKRWQELYEGLIRMERIRAEIEQLESSQQHDRIEACLIQCQKVGEQIFNNLRLKYPPQQEWKQLSENDKAGNRSFINALAKHLGFTEPLPPSLIDVRKGKIRSAAEYGSSSLRPHILAALLAARIFPDHPLHNLANNYPNILSDLNKLATLRDESSHASSRASPEINLNEVDRCIDTIYCLTACIFNLSYSSN